MKTEYEAKFINVNIKEIRQKLKAVGGSLEQPMRLMRRVTIDSPFMKQNNGFLRVRDEGDRTTMTYKQFDRLSVDGAKEHEICVDNFNEAVTLLDAIGLSYTSFQESKRETWRLGHTEIVIDEWPWLEPYVEIEAGDENSVREVAEKLGFSWPDAIFGDVMAAYREQYPHLTKSDTIASIRKVTFDSPLPDLLQKSD